MFRVMSFEQQKLVSILILEAFSVSGTPVLPKFLWDKKLSRNVTSMLPTFLLISDGYVLMVIYSCTLNNTPIDTMPWRCPEQTKQAHLFPIAFTNNNHRNMYIVWMAYFCKLWRMWKWGVQHCYVAFQSSLIIPFYQ